MQAVLEIATDVNTKTYGLDVIIQAMYPDTDHLNTRFSFSDSS